MKCLRCGADMDATTGGNFHCSKCRMDVNDLVYRESITRPIFNEGTETVPHDNNIADGYNFNFGQTGWICPKCGRALSPWTSVCPCYRSDGISYLNGIECTSTDHTVINGSDIDNTVTPKINDNTYQTDGSINCQNSFIE